MDRKYQRGSSGQFVKEEGVKPLLIDLPSVNRGYDEGKQLLHKA